MTASIVLAMALAFGAGCGQIAGQTQVSDAEQQQAEEQRQRNEELQKELEAQQEELEAQQEELDAQKEEQEAAEREAMEQEIEDLKDQVAENESEPQETGQPESGSNAPEVIIESNDDWTAPPSEAPEGIVVVSPDYDVAAVTELEAQALDAAIAYYQLVEVGDYYATHGLLSEEDQGIYPLDAWVDANTSLDSAAAEFVVTGAYPDDVGNGRPTYAVTLEVYLTDGTASDRTTYFTDEGNGYWAHWLSQEEMDLFSGAV